jgi:hypothetical protein
MSLNEKLAEVCGMEWKQVYWWKDGQVAYYHHNAVDCSRPGLDHWSPTADLNQLRECYLALSEDEQIRMAELTLYAPFDAIFTQTELVAQAILKAKGVV